MTIMVRSRPAKVAASRAWSAGAFCGGRRTGALTPRLVVATIGAMLTLQVPLVPASAAAMAALVRTHQAPATVATDYASTIAADGAVVAYTLDDAAGTSGPGSVADSGAAGPLFNGAPSGGVTFGTGHGQVNAAGSALFDGTSGFVQIPPPSVAGGAFSTISDFTVEGWFNAPSTFLSQGFIVTLLGTTSGIGVNNGHPFASVVESGVANPDVMTSAVVANDGRWHHVAITRSASTMTLYVDGAQDQQIQATGPLAFNSSNPGAIGSNGSTFFFGGYLEDIAGYTGALSADQLLRHYLIGRGAPLGGPLAINENPASCNPSQKNTGSSQGHCGDPINTASGVLSESAQDLTTPGRGINLSMARSYSSALVGAPAGPATGAPPGALGPGWSYNYAMSVTKPDSATAVVTQENGSQATFTQQGAAWVPAAPRTVATLSLAAGTWTFVRNQRDTFTFDAASGRLTTEQDLAGKAASPPYATTLDYSTPNTQKVTDPAGRTYTFTFDTTGRLRSVTEPPDSSAQHSGIAIPTRTVTYAYNDADANLTDVVDSWGGHWSYGYASGTHLLTSVRAPRYFGDTATSPSPVTTNVYDTSVVPARVSSQTDPMGRTTSLCYGGSGGSTCNALSPAESVPANATLVVLPKVHPGDTHGNQTLEQYFDGELVAVTKGYLGTAGSGSTWRYTYDPVSLGTASVTDPNGNTTRMTYDPSGNPVTITDARGFTTRSTYTAFNGLASRTDPRDARYVTTLTRDPSTDELSVSSTPVFDGSGNPEMSGGSQLRQVQVWNHADAAHPADVTSTSIDDPDAAHPKTTLYAYDSVGDRSQVVDPLTNKTTTVFDLVKGWPLSSVSPRGNVSGGNAGAFTTSYDYVWFPGFAYANDPAHPAGVLATVTDPLGHQSSRHTDLNGQLDRATDADNRTTTYVRDPDNEQIVLGRPDATQLKSDFNGDSTVADTIDGAGAMTTNSYDAQQRLIATTDANLRQTSYFYDPAGNQIAKLDPSPSGTTNSCPQVLVPPPSAQAGAGIGCTIYGYDPSNEPTSITFSDSWSQNTTFSYDGAGQRTQMHDGSGTTTSRYDSLGRITSDQSGAGATTAYSYNQRNLVTTITYPNAQKVKKVYDDVGRLTKVTDWLANTSSFGFDADSDPTTIRLPSTTGITDQSVYNNADQLTKITDKKGTATLFVAAYGRDPYGQLTSDNSQAAPVRDYRYTALNQLCYAAGSTTAACANPPPGSTAYGYDHADNLSLDGMTTQSFDGANQLCWTLNGAAAAPCGAPPTGATRYSYDSRGNRTAVTPASGPATSLGYDQANRLVSANTTTFAYDGSGLRMSKATGSTTSRFSWDVSGRLPRLLADGSNLYVYGAGGLPLEQIGVVTGTVTWLHHDQLGSTRMLTDSGGRVGPTFSYDPYGNLTATGVAAAGYAAAAISPLAFAGQYADPETGLIYLQARYYDPTTAQFLSRDPAVATTGSAYGYVSGNPLNGADPTGLGCGWSDPLGCASDAVSAVGNAASAALPVIHTVANVVAGAASLCAIVTSETIVGGLTCGAIALGAAGVSAASGGVLYAQGRESGTSLALDVAGLALSGVGSLAEAGAAASKELSLGADAMSTLRRVEMASAPWYGKLGPYFSSQLWAVKSGLWGFAESGLSAISRILSAASFGLSAYGLACNP